MSTGQMFPALEELEIWPWRLIREYSTYKDAMHQWLESRFREDIDMARRTNRLQTLCVPFVNVADEDKDWLTERVKVIVDSYTLERKCFFFWNVWA